MKFSIEWLRTWVNIQVPIDELVIQLTQLGLEVESVEAGHIIDVAVPPNRGDCLSIIGIARELAVLNKIPINKAVSVEPVPPTINAVLPISVQDSNDCPKYLGRIFKNINANAKTPQWLQKILAEAGLNSISAVVDITNYVMLELGQPMHAFDLQAINNEIIVRKARPKEELVLLDQTTIILQPEDLVIADKQKPLALAGIMGGVASSVANDTTDILLECAYFAPVGIRLTARRHNLGTDSSYRFERSVDATLQEQALARATRLLQEIVGGQPGPVIVVEDRKALPAPDNIILRKARIKKILGIYPGDNVVGDILTSLGMICLANDAGWNIIVPLHRKDITLEIDLIEEIARFIGYQDIPALIPQGRLNFKQHPEAKTSEFNIKSCLQCRGYAEVITYSFIAPELASLFAPDAQYLKLLNPISEDMSVMRPNLWPGLVKVLQYNENRQCNKLRIFEIGLKFVITEGQQLKQEKVLSGLCVGQVQQEHWDLKNHMHDFFDVKGDIEALGKLTGIGKLYYKPTNHPALHPGKSAAIFIKQECIGYLGELHPRLLKALDFTTQVFVFELDLAALTKGDISKFCCISKFPGIRRDLAIVVDESIIAQDIENAIKESTGELLQDLCIFDVYCGQGVEQGKKSIGLGIILQHPSHTMVDEEIKQILEKIIGDLKLKFNATLR